MERPAVASIIDEQAYRQFEKEGYSRVAQEYAARAAIFFAQINDALLTAAGVDRGYDVLDVACGPGLLIRDAISRGAHVTAIDFAPDMVAIARAKNPGADVVEGDAEDLPFEDAKFDAVVCNLGLLHFPNPERATREAFRVLKSGGRYAFTTWTPPNINPLMGLVLGSIQAHGTLAVNLPAGPPLFRFGDPQECTALLCAAGFADVSTTEGTVYWNCPTPEEFIPGLLNSSARLGPLLAGQNREQRQAVEAAIRDGCQKFETLQGVKIPATLMISSARKP
jgi:SAM-dependent methyltransferase